MTTITAEAREESSALKWGVNLMTLAALEIWCRLFIDPIVIAPPSMSLDELGA